MVYLQGGPSHLDLWDPKEMCPTTSAARSRTSPRRSPASASPRSCRSSPQINDKFTMIRSMSYTPNGLFNHTAAIYQMMTGYTTDKVSPSGQLEPPNAQGLPELRLATSSGCKPPTEPMLPFVMLPRPLQESNVVGKGGTAGFLGKAFDPYTLYPDGDDMDMAKMDRIKVDDLKLRPDVFAVRLAAPRQAPRPHQRADAGHREGRREEQPRRVLRNARSASSSPAAPAMRSTSIARARCAPRPATAATPSAKAACSPAGSIEAGTRVVEVIWPKVANSDNHSWDHHVDLTKRMKNQSGPMLDTGLSALIDDLDKRGMLEDTLVVGIGEFGRSPQKGVSTSGNGNSADGRDHWPYCYTAVMAGAGIKRGYVHGKTDKTASAPLEDPGPSRPSSWRRSTTRSASTPRRSSTTTSTSRASW